MALPAFSGVEDDIDLIVLDPVDDMRPALRDLVDPLDLEPFRLEIVGGATGGDHVEAQRNQPAHRRHDDGLVAVLHRDEQAAGGRQVEPRALLRFEEGGREIACNPHDFAGGLHLGRQYRIDAREARKGEDRLLDRDIAEVPPQLRQVRQFLPRHHPRGELRDRRADRLGDEGHGAAGARIDLDQIDHPVLHRELDVHQPDDAERSGKQARLPLDLGDDGRLQAVGGQRAGAVARMDARLLDMLHDAGDDDIRAVRDCIHVDLDRVAQILVDQHRAVAGDLDGGVDIVVQLGRGIDDLHRPPPEHIGGAGQHRIADPLGNHDRLVPAAGDAVQRLAQIELVDQLREPLPVLGKIDRVGRGAEDRNALILQRLGELQRGLPAELDDDAVERPARLLDMQDLQHVLNGERFEIEPIRRVVVGRDGLRIAIDHHRFVARLLQGVSGVDAAVIELDPLPDPVRPAAEDHDLLPVARLALILRLAEAGRLIGRVHVGRLRLEFGGAGVDPLEHRADAELLAQPPDLGLGGRADHRLDRVVQQAVRARPRFHPATGDVRGL